jgi:threonine/homoserine/homoserine lactone efflux protein
VWAQGVIVNIFNPKTALFVLAFLPQFVDRTSTIWTQVAFLGCLFSLIAFSSDLMYALLADALASRIRRGGRAAAIRRWVSGGIFVALGVTAAAAHRS